MSNVIYLNEWKRERLGAVQPRTCQRRSRRGQGRKETLTAGFDLSRELLELLRHE